MAAVHQGYGPASSGENLPTPGFFTAALGADENHNVFEQAFQAGPDQFIGIKDPKTHPTAGLNPDTDSFLRGLDHVSFSPLFAFSAEPQSPSLIEKPKQMVDGPNVNDAFSSHPTKSDWNAAQPFAVDQTHILPSQEISPPNSAQSPPNQWPYQDRRHETNSPLQQSWNQQKGPSARAELGQITPPSDDASSSYNSRRHLGGHNSFSMQTPEDTEGTPKRRRGKQAKNESTETKPIRRQRKSTAQSKNQGSETNAKANEDVKRNKFLERNRVAASKCRQKKKEWTGNLEGRARELQQDKAQLSVMVSSLKDEMIFLKGELLKHTDCDCAKIRQYLNREATNFASKSPQKYQEPISAASPVGSGVESMMSSRNGSMSTADQNFSLGFGSLEASPAFDSAENYNHAANADQTLEAFLNADMGDAK
jgi:hypothetical protein